MTKILFLLNYVGKGGTEKYVLDLINAAGPENCVFLYSEEGPGLEQFKRSNVKIYQVNMNGPFDLKAARQIRQVIQTEKVTVVHAQFLRENYLAILAKWMGARCKVIWTYHVDVPMGKGIRILNQFMTSSNKKVITVSQFMFQQLQKKGVPKSKLKLIYNGVAQPAKEHTMAGLREVPVISVVGRLREEKGQAFLLRSLAALRDRDPAFKWKCHIYGEGPQYEELTALVTELHLENLVEFKGFCTDKEMLYLNSDIIVIPSNNESLSYVAIEALSYSRVVVASNVGGLPEVVKDGETGMLVSYGDSEQLAQTFKKLFTNRELVQKLSRNGRKYFDEHFTFKKMMEETSALYKQ